MQLNFVQTPQHPPAIVAAHGKSIHPANVTGIRHRWRNEVNGIGARGNLQ